ncbi:MULTISPECIES: hypothetical protein [Bacteroides]|jgi:hypothetical protein|uniref:hypothetical protein n=1 Tax=Bacteroides TaxID=816 RepID=UPI001921D075|nr:MULTISPECIES: hypothetical protein [Bacteroides]MCS2363095.1 hypothetical protein [Bacteroides thetaiotaomicron]DAP59261.1 MAG TPA: prohead serine protease [Caudoviricetes sp.]
MAKRIVISDESVNCYGTWVKTEGADISQYERNPVLLWMHWRGIIIGCIKDIRKEGDKITGEPYFDEVRDESKLAKQQWEKGTLKMASAHFEVLETSDAAELIKPGQYRATAVRSKLIEVSMVDIGGNDNALPLMLSFKGEELKLSAGEENDSLPLLNNNKNQKKEEKMDYKAIALKLGLLETAGENEILSSIDLLLGYKTANQQLQQEKEQLQLSAITQTVKEAVAKHLILAEKETHFIELGQKVGIDSLKLTFDSMTPIQKPLNLINTTGGGSSISLDWKKLSDVPIDKMEELRNNDKPTYMKLYKAEYGVDCPKY